jgi:hypothetical protein
MGFSNVIVIATQKQQRLGKAEVIHRAQCLEAQGKGSFPIEKFVHTYIMDRIPKDDVPVLTDDYAPVDALLHLWHSKVVKW